MRLWVEQVMAKNYEDPDISDIEVEVKEPTTKSSNNGRYYGYDDDYANGAYGY